MFLAVLGNAGETLVNLDQVDVVYVRGDEDSNILLRSGRTIECTKRGAEQVAEAVKKTFPLF